MLSLARFILLMLLLVALWATPEVAGPVGKSPEQALPEFVTVENMGVHGLHCRQGPSTGAPLIRILFDGETVPVRGTVVDGWLPVECAGEDGWVKADAVSTVP